MKIETKFNVGDNVFFIFHDDIICRIVERIEITVSKLVDFSAIYYLADNSIDDASYNLRSYLRRGIHQDYLFTNKLDGAKAIREFVKQYNKPIDKHQMLLDELNSIFDEEKEQNNTINKEKPSSVINKLASRIYSPYKNDVLEIFKIHNRTAVGYEAQAASIIESIIEYLDKQWKKNNEK